MTMLHIGIDFDHTIVCYDGVFYKAALEQNLIPASLSPHKTHVRDYFRSIQREEEWTRLQGYVYGCRMELAKPYPGISSFFENCLNDGIKISIISHKTKYPYLGPKYDLHWAARNWLENQSFFNPKLDVYFELTLAQKLQRILAAECDLFVDDLPELLNEPAFPSKVHKILFDPANLHPINKAWTTLTSWEEGLSILKLHLKF